METNDDYKIYKELIIEDFKLYSDSIMGDRNRIYQCRQWEITILVGLIALKFNLMSAPQFLFSFISIIISFAFYEIIVRGRMSLLASESSEVWKHILSKTDKIITSSYEYGVIRWQKVSVKKKIKFTFKSLLSPDFLAWNLSIIVINIVIYLF